MTSLAFSRSRWAGIVAWLALPIVGCTQVTDDKPILDTPQVALIVRDRSRGPLEDVAVCGSDPNNCVMTDAEGRATLELPAEREETTWTLEKDGWGRVVVGDLSEDIATTIIMFKDEWLEGEYRRVGSVYPLVGTGTVVFWTDPALEGVTFELVNATGIPYYFDGSVNTELHATTRLGSGGFIEVGPGDVEIKVGGTAERCDLQLGWPGNADDTIRVPVQEGYHTHASIACPLPQRGDGP